MLRIVLRPMPHPLRVDRCRLDARDDPAIARHRVHHRQRQPRHSGAARGQHLDRLLDRRRHRRIGIIEEVVGRDADAHAAHIAVQRALVVGHRQVRAGGVLRVAPGDQRHHAGAIPRGARQRADIVQRERQRHCAVATDAGLRRLKPGDAAGRRRQPDRPAGVGPERRIDEPRRHRRAGPRRRAASDIGQVPRIVAVAELAIMPGRVLRELRHVEPGKRIGAGASTAARSRSRYNRARNPCAGATRRCSGLPAW